MNKTDANGTTTNYTYDSLNRLKSVACDLLSVDYSYDAVGNLKNLVDATDITQYTYDSKNRLIQETHPSGMVVRYEYDNVGNRTKVINPWARAVISEYVGANRLTWVTDP